MCIKPTTPKIIEISLHILELIPNQRELIRLELVLLRQQVSTVLRERERRRKQWINCNSEGMLKDLRNQPHQQRRTRLQAWVSVYLDEPDLEVLVNHEVKPEELESMLSFLRIDFAVHRLDSIPRQGLYDLIEWIWWWVMWLAYLHLGHAVLEETVLFIGETLVQVFLEFSE